MRWFSRTTLTVCAVCAVAGCDLLGPEGSISQSEAAAIASAMMGQSMGAGFVGADNAQQPAANVLDPALSAASVPVTVEKSTVFTAPCAGGGSVGVTMDYVGSSDTESSVADLSFDMVHAHSACGVMAEEGKVFVLTGDPNLAVSLDLNVDAVGDFQMDGTYDGAVQWVEGDRSGRCVVALTFSITGGQNTQNASATMEGEVCGVSLSQSVTVG